MKHLFFGICLIFSPFVSFSQKTITLPKDMFQISNRKFYVTEVIDKRKNKKFIGELWTGAFKKTDKITIEGGIDHYLQNWFLSNFPKTSDQQKPVQVLIKNISINQSASYSEETGEAFAEFEFVDILDYKYKFYSKISEKTDDAFSSHPQRLMSVFRDCVIKFNNSIPDNNSQVVKTEDDAVEIVFNNNDQTSNPEKYTEKPEKIRSDNNRNVIAIGYQIGGYTLLGVDYEVRVLDYVGIHFGAGFLGYTAGLKIHTNKTKNSMFFNASWKDTGLGLMNGFALEAGDRWIWSKKRDFGLYYQAGIFAINHIDSDFESVLFSSGYTPQVIFSVGVGLSW